MSNDKTMEMIVGKSVEISADTSAAINKLPKVIRSIAQSITEAEAQLKDKARTAITGIQNEALSLEKRRAAQIAVMIASYDMSGKDAPFKNWGEFARDAWNRSPAWISVQRRVGATFINANETETIAKQIADSFTVSQMQEMLPLVDKKTDKISPALDAAITNKSITPDMPCTGEGSIREYVESLGAKKEQKEKPVDILFPATSERMNNVLLSEYAPDSTNDIQFRLNFDPKTTDTERGNKPYKGIVLVNVNDFSTQVILYHAHVPVQLSADEVKTISETERKAFAIREMPEEFRADIVKSYKGLPNIDYEKLCLMVGVIDKGTEC